MTGVIIAFAPCGGRPRGLFATFAVPLPMPQDNVMLCATQNHDMLIGTSLPLPCIYVARCVTIMAGAERTIPPFSPDLPNKRKTMTQDAQAIAEAFKLIAKAAGQINEVLCKNQHLNETVPTNWPLGMSADEFADQCWAMADHYTALAKNG